MAGRHREGRIYSTVEPRRWDERQSAWAAHLDRNTPNWSIIYGPWSRVFWAFAAWPAPRPLVVDARTPEGLWEEMRAAEASPGMAGVVVSEQEMHGFGPVEQDDQGCLSAEHEESGWTILARNEQTLKRMAGVVRRASRLRGECDGR
jgi:hypothetical protein